MNNYLVRIVALFLVPCFVADPVSASSFVQHFGPSAWEGSPHDGARQTHFEYQAFSMPAVAGFEDEEGLAIRLRKAGRDLSRAENRKAQQILDALPPLEGVVKRLVLQRKIGIMRATITKYLPIIISIENVRRLTSGRQPLFLSTEDGISSLLSRKIIPSAAQAMELLRVTRRTITEHHYVKRKAVEEKKRRAAALVEKFPAAPVETALVPHSSAANILAAIHALVALGIKVSLRSLSRKTNYSESFIKDQIKAHPLLLRAFTQARRDQALQKPEPVAAQSVARANPPDQTAVKKVTPGALNRKPAGPDVAITPYHQTVIDKFVKSGEYSQEIVNQVLNCDLIHYEKVLAKMSEHMSNFRAMHVLGIGSASGEVIDALRRFGVKDIVGLEREPEFVVHANAQTPPIPLFQGDLRRIPPELMGRKFDVIFSYRALDTATLEDLAAMSGLLTDNGWGFHVFWETPALQEEDFRRAGFKVVEFIVEESEIKPPRKRVTAVVRKLPRPPSSRNLVQKVQRLIVLLVAVFPLFGFTSVPGTISGSLAAAVLGTILGTGLVIWALGMAQIPPDSDSNETYPYPVWGMFDYTTKNSWMPGLEEAINPEAEISWDSVFELVPTPSKNAKEFITFLADHPFLRAPGIDVLCVLADPRDQSMSLLMDKYSAEHPYPGFKDTVFSDFLFGIYNQKRTVFVPMNLVPVILDQPESQQVMAVGGLLSAIAKRSLTTPLMRNSERKHSPKKEGGMWPLMIPLYDWLAEHVHALVGYHLAPAVLETGITLGVDFLALFWLTSAPPTGALLLSPLNLAAIQVFWALLHIIPPMSYLRDILYLESSQIRGLLRRFLEAPSWRFLGALAAITWITQIFSIYFVSPASPSLGIDLVFPAVLLHSFSGVFALWLLDSYDDIATEVLFALQINGKVELNLPPEEVEFRRILHIFEEFNWVLHGLRLLEKETNAFGDYVYGLRLIPYTERRDRLVDILTGHVEALWNWINHSEDLLHLRMFPWYILPYTNKLYLIDKFLGTKGKRGFDASLDELLPAIAEIFYGIPSEPYRIWLERQIEIISAAREDVSPATPRPLRAAS